MPSSSALHDPVLSNEWFAVATSHDVVDAPKKVTVLGEDVVLWRSLSGLHAFQDLCIHRGTALSLGQVDKNELICAYHGWRFNGDGQCVAIPAQPADMTIPTKAKATRYHVQEKYGLIWVNLGDGAQPLPSYPDAEDASMRMVICGPYHVNAAAPRVIENFLDVSHLMWVHEGLLGVPSHAEIPDYRVHEQNGELVSDTIQIYQPDPDGRGKVVNNDYVYKVLSSLTASFRKTDSSSSDVFSMMLHAAPNAARETTAYAVLCRNYAHDMDDRTFIEFQNKVFAQDEAILVSQRPEELPLDLQQELHLKSDRLAIAYRQYLQSRGVTLGTS